MDSLDLSFCKRYEWGSLIDRDLAFAVRLCRARGLVLFQKKASKYVFSSVDRLGRFTREFTVVLAFENDWVTQCEGYATAQAKADALAGEEG